MAELNIGKHCNYEHCNLLDFLPCPCNRCGLNYCKEHMSYESHHCTGKDPAIVTDMGNSSNGCKSYSCSVANCNRRELVPISCDACGEIVCLLHRHPADHSCKNTSAPAERMTKTAEQVQQILSARENSEKKKAAPTSQKSRAIAAKVALMKLKQKAVGDKGIPEADRVFFNVVMPIGSKNSTTSVYLNKTWSVGRAVDKISNMLDIRNENNKATARQLCLFSSFSGVSLPSDQLLDTILQNCTDSDGPGQVYNGSTLILEYVDRGLKELPSLEPYAKFI